jgi:hypothetical protein
MKPELPYRYTLLRYEHDVRTEEFLNVGVLFWVPETRFLDLLFTEKSTRIKAAFPDVDASELTEAFAELRSKLASLGSTLSNDEDILDIAHRALPHDDSSLKWSPVSAGRATHPKAVLEAVYDRTVSQYERRRKPQIRSDIDIWNDLAKRLKTHSVLEHFHQTVVRTPIRRYQFNYAWQNERPHIVVPVSLDAVNEEGVADKATRWAGQIMDLSRSDQLFNLDILLGEPTKPKLKPEYEGAVEFLTAGIHCDRIQVTPQASVSQFAERVANQIKSHVKASG